VDSVVVHMSRESHVPLIKPKKRRLSECPPSTPFAGEKGGTLEFDRMRNEKMIQSETVEERAETCRTIQRLGARLKMPQTSIAVAVVLYHRATTAIRGAVQEPFSVQAELAAARGTHMAVACIYLAGKATEHTRKVRDVINVQHHLEHAAVCLVDEDFWTLRKHILALEQCILRAINFETSIPTPHCYLLNCCNTLKVSSAFVRLCWALLLDSAQLAVVALEPPEVQAIAVMLVAAQILPYETGFLRSGHITWWQSFCPKSVSQAKLEEVGNFVLSLYEANIQKKLNMADDPLRPKVEFSLPVVNYDPSKPNA